MQAEEALAIALKKSKTYAQDILAGAVDGITFKGSVQYVNSLPSGATLGDMYLVQYSGSSGTSPLNAKYVYNGTNWILYSNTISDSGLGITIN